MTVSRSTGQIQRRYGTNLVSVDSSGAGLAGRNAIINGCFRIAQRGTSFTSAGTYQNDDDSYLLDRWVLLSDGDDIADITQETSVIPDGALNAIKFDIETGSKKCGILQIVDSKDTAKLWKNQTGIVSLSFQARTTGGVVENIRAAVLAWDDAADTVTSDVVDTWEAEGTNPGLVANWTYENEPDDLALANSYTKYQISGIALDTASTTNLAVFIWIDDGDLAITDVLYITEVQLEPGNFCTPFENRTFGDELFKCQRYFQKTFDYGTAPAQNAGTNGVILGIAPGGDVGDVVGSWRFVEKMKSVPSMTYFNPSVANSKWDNIDGNDPTSADLYVGATGVIITDGDGAQSALDRCFIHATADAEL